MLEQFGNGILVGGVSSGSQGILCGNVPFLNVLWWLTKIWYLRVLVDGQVDGRIMNKPKFCKDFITPYQQSENVYRFDTLCANSIALVSHCDLLKGLLKR